MITSTVENYLKCIFVESGRSPEGHVATGRIAASMHVAPGTVTAMMKTLTESGLVDYEPYVGVRLTPAGSKLAKHVLRRHRLVELFLVRIMGMDWSEVHEEAEVLEHAVSDRLIERIDEMLDHPSTDPHGDPIPTAGGAVDAQDYPSLLTCEPEMPLQIARITDQRSRFLQLLEQHQLVPGRRAKVESRDEVAQTVRVQPEDGPPLQLAFQAASKVLVEPL
jgi:DtxR family Mn-dependent transcriptional regulator